MIGHTLYSCMFSEFIFDQACPNFSMAYKGPCLCFLQPKNNRRPRVKILIILCVYQKQHGAGALRKLQASLEAVPR